MRALFTALFFCAAAAPASADCALDTITAALESPVDGLRLLERPVSDVQSAEGGEWRIYREPDGRVHSIIRIDAGESGRSETRLSMVNRQTYGIARTRVDYLRHAFIEDGPFGIARRTTEYFYYCDGKPHVPGQAAAVVDVITYPKAAVEAQQLMVLDKDVADFTRGLAH
jgi:hypothetical protein